MSCSYTLTNRLIIKLAKRWFEADINNDLAEAINNEVWKFEERYADEIPEGELADIIWEVLEDNGIEYQA